MHEQGLAIDFTADGDLIRSRSYPAFTWLANNAERFGFYNLPSEPALVHHRRLRRGCRLHPTDVRHHHGDVAAHRGGARLRVASSGCCMGSQAAVQSHSGFFRVGQLGGALAKRDRFVGPATVARRAGAPYAARGLSGSRKGVQPRRSVEGEHLAWSAVRQHRSRL